MKVVHCKREPFTVYIGRPSLLGNPFPVEKYGRDAAIQRFDDYARQSARMLDVIYALTADAVLGCWCHNQPCHGDAIIRIWKELHS